MTFHGKLLGFLVLVVAIGEAAAFAGHPFLYCQVWTPWLWRPFLQSAAPLALLICAFYFLWALISAGLLSIKAFGAAILMAVFGGLDDWARIFLAVGRSCQ